MADIATSMKFTLPSANPDGKVRGIIGWDQVSQHLAKGMDNPGSLQEAVMSFQKLREFPAARGSREVYEPVGLLNAITQFQESFSQTGKPFDFYGAVLPKIAEWAMEMPSLFEDGASQIPVLHVGRSAQVVLSRAQARCLLSHMFFGTLTPLPHQFDPEFVKAHYPRATIFGEPFFDRVYLSERRVAIERIKCQLAYFTVNAESFPEPPAGSVRFSRLHSEISGLPDWGAMEVPIPRAVVTSSEKIEDSPAATHVDFANKHLHIGQVIPSVTQEELLFSLRPELFLGLLISPTMMDRESIYMDGALWYNTYSGYLDSFCFTGFTPEIKEVLKDPSKGGETSCVVAIDAIVAGSSQFQKELVDRDLGKAWLGFNGPREICPDSRANPVEGDPNTSIVSTGNWGCGIFGGDHFLKFLQQVMAAGACGKSLHYSTFGAEVLGREIGEISRKMTEQGETVASVYRFLTTTASSSRSPGEFRDHLAAWLGVSVKDANDPNQCSVM